MLTLESIKNKVREITKERPDVTYETFEGGCHYDAGECSDGTIGCIFGQVSAALGEPMTGTKSITHYFNDPWCILVQQYQDRGMKWSVAIQRADIMYPKIGEG